MAAELSPVPFRGAIVQPGSWLASLDWQRWFVDLVKWVNQTAKLIGSVALTAQGAAIAATAVPTPTLKTALYRVSYSTRITRAATTSSELTITIRWTSGGVACSQAGTLLNGNLTSTQQSGVLIVHADKDTTIRYEATYVSVGATSMAFRLDIRVEQLP